MLWRSDGEDLEGIWQYFSVGNRHVILVVAWFKGYNKGGLFLLHIIRFLFYLSEPLESYILRLSTLMVYTIAQYFSESRFNSG